MVVIFITVTLGLYHLAVTIGIWQVPPLTCQPHAYSIFLLYRAYEAAIPPEAFALDLSVLLW